MAKYKINHKRDDAGSIIVRGLSIDVTILEVRTMQGKTRYLVSPMAGSGQLWVEIVYPKRVNNA